MVGSNRFCSLGVSRTVCGNHGLVARRLSPRSGDSGCRPCRWARLCLLEYCTRRGRSRYCSSRFDGSRSVDGLDRVARRVDGGIGFPGRRSGFRGTRAAGRLAIRSPPAVCGCRSSSRDARPGRWRVAHHSRGVSVFPAACETAGCASAVAVRGRGRIAVRRVDLAPSPRPSLNAGAGGGSFENPDSLMDPETE